MELIAKELSNADHSLSDKMQVTTILNSLPLSWDHVITSLTHSGREISMVTLPVLLVLEEERMKRRRKEGLSFNLLMTQSSPQPQNNTHTPFNKKKTTFFKKKWKKGFRKDGRNHKNGKNNNITSIKLAHVTSAVKKVISKPIVLRRSRQRSITLLP